MPRRLPNAPGIVAGRTRPWSATAAVAIVLASLAVRAQDPEVPEELPEDPRVAVAMPALQQALLRREMVEHTTTLHRVLGHLAEGELAQAAAVAEEQLGVSSMGRHAAATAGAGPGRFMPAAMRAIGVGMHEAASRFAEVARDGDVDAAYRALQPVTAACVACHVGYRLE